MPAPQSDHQRLIYLDLTKGVLVVIMVIYHALNYSSQYYLSFRYLSFLPPSFIVITGLLLTIVYPRRYRELNASLFGRLTVRGLKILALFVALNVGARLILGTYKGWVPVDAFLFFSRFFEVFVSGLGRSAIFEVLLPIAYLLLAAPFLLWLSHGRMLLYPVVAILIVSICLLLNRWGAQSEILSLFSAGVIGMTIGALVGNLQILLSKWSAFIISALVFLAYMPLGIAYGYIYPVQLVGALAALALIMSMSTHVVEPGWLLERLLRLGRYSLVSYIVQIALLQVGLRILGRPDPGSPLFFGILFGALVLMVSFVEAIDWMRRRSRPMERLYKFVFA